MRYLLILFMLTFYSCCKDPTSYPTIELLTQTGGWKLTAILSKDSTLLISNPSYPIVWIHFNTDGTINGNLDGKYTLLDEHTMKYSMQLDTNYWPYPQIYYDLYAITKNEHTANVKFYGFKELEITNDSRRLHFVQF